MQLDEQIIEDRDQNAFKSLDYYEKLALQSMEYEDYAEVNRMKDRQFAWRRPADERDTPLPNARSVHPADPVVFASPWGPIDLKTFDSDSDETDAESVESDWNIIDLENDEDNPMEPFDEYGPGGTPRICNIVYK